MMSSCALHIIILISFEHKKHQKMFIKNISHDKLIYKKGKKEKNTKDDLKTDFRDINMCYLSRIGAFKGLL